MKTYGFAEFHRHFSDNTLDFNHGHIGILVVWVTGIVMFQQPYKMVNDNFRKVFKHSVKGQSCKHCAVGCSNGYGAREVEPSSQLLSTN